MPFRSSDLTVQALGDDTWLLVGPLVYDGRWQTFVVPAGFETDFASVPRLVVWLVPRFGRYTRAAILHDWLCTVGISTGAVTSREADGLFRRALRDSGVPVLRRWLMWCGVRWGALDDPLRRPGWLVSAPGVLAVSLVAAPLVLPPALATAPALLLYTLAERVLSSSTSLRAARLVRSLTGAGRSGRGGSGRAVAG